jgi:hypothetical protein
MEDAGSMLSLVPGQDLRSATKFGEFGQGAQLTAPITQVGEEVVFVTPYMIYSDGPYLMLCTSHAQAVIRYEWRDHILSISCF